MSWNSLIPDRLLPVMRDLRRSYDGRAGGVGRTLSPSRHHPDSAAALLAVASPTLKP